MLRVSLLVVFVGVGVASACLFSHKPTISSEFRKINDWLADNLADNKDGFANVRAASEHLASARSSMKAKELEAWELFTSLARVESECSLEGAKLIHRNFDEAAISWPPSGETTPMRINVVLLDVQRKTVKRCAEDYDKIVRASDPRDSRAPEALQEFGGYWQQYIYKNGPRFGFPDAESDPFAKKFAGLGDLKMAKLLYHSISTNRDVKVGSMVKPKLSEKTGKKEPASAETAKSYLKIFYDECDQLISKLDGQIDLMMVIIEEPNYLRDTYRKILICKRLNENYKLDKLAKALVKISMNKFRISQ